MKKYFRKADKYKFADNGFKRLRTVLITLANNSCPHCGRTQCKLFMVKIGTAGTIVYKDIFKYQILCYSCFTDQKIQHPNMVFDDLRPDWYVQKIKNYHYS